MFDEDEDERIIPARKWTWFNLVCTFWLFMTNLLEVFRETSQVVTEDVMAHANYKIQQRMFANAVRTDIEAMTDAAE